jgi:putative addiction module component (TIGR02574 family)
MDLASIVSAANSLSLNDRIRLLEAVWDGIIEVHPLLELTNPQRQELERRTAAYQTSPDDVIPWEQVKAEALARSCRHRLCN